MEKAIIELEDVWKTYPLEGVEVHALRGVNAKIRKGEFVAIVGPSGSGKSTMMSLVGCLDLPTKGTIRLDGRDIAGMSESDLAQVRGRKIGFVFQSFNLINTLTAFQNVTLPLIFQDIDAGERGRRANGILDNIGLSQRKGHYPNQMSGGEQQRVAISRALATQPEIILADEPTGNLDSKNGEEIIKTLEKLHGEGKTVVMVTHDPNLAKRAKRQIRLKDGQVVE